jgi:hypothetical protein
MLSFVTPGVAVCMIGVVAAQPSLPDCPPLPNSGEHSKLKLPVNQDKNKKKEKAASPPQFLVAILSNSRTRAVMVCADYSHTGKNENTRIS